MEQLPTLRGENLQDIVVNAYRYKPVGDWSASGFGDAQLYGQYLFHDGAHIKNAAKLGANLPTGRPNDPDNILDVPFGRGYLGTFIEAMNDIYLLSEDRLILNAYARYEYNWPTVQAMRLPSNASMPLTADRGDVRIEPGDSWTFIGGAESRVLYDLRIYGNYIFYYKNRDRMSGDRNDYDYSILATGTDGHGRTAEIGAFYSTTDLYLKKKFPIPFKVKGSYAQTLAGNNMEIVDMAYVEFQLYF
jgi:hypothetical protein